MERFGSVLNNSIKNIRDVDFLSQQNNRFHLRIVV